MRVILAYKNFAIHKGISHIGLGVAGINTAKTLRRAGVMAEVWPILDANHLRILVNLSRSHKDDPAITHVIVSAPWISSPSWLSLTRQFPNIIWTVNCHSNVGFLQADTNGTRLLREAMEVEKGNHNFHLAGNSLKFVTWIRDAFEVSCVYLPNLYFLTGTETVTRHLWTGGTLRLGAFGAVRPLKNFLSAVGASIQLATQLKADTEIWVNSGRTEGGGHTVMSAARALIAGLPNIALREAPWTSWPMFVRTVGNMHLLLQPSYTESFNMVTADGIAAGIPSVVSEAIDWVPKYWQAEVDDVNDITRVSRQLLFDPRASTDGFAALRAYVRTGVGYWKEYLEHGENIPS